MDFIKRILNNQEKSEAELIPVAGERINISTGEGDLERTWCCTICKTCKLTFCVEIRQILPGKCPFVKEQRVCVSIPRGEKTAKFFAQIICLKHNKEDLVLELPYPASINWTVTRRRRHERIKIKMIAKVKNKKAGEEEWNMVRLFDFSISGFGFLSSTPYKVGELVEIKVLSEDFPLAMAAVVRRICHNEDASDGAKLKYVVGVEFEQLNRRDSDKITGYYFTMKGKK